MSLSNTLPNPVDIDAARSRLISSLPSTGIGEKEVAAHLQDVIAPALNQSSRSPNYYGFVTGGCLPAASLADNLVTHYDQNVALHLPNESIATDVEDAALRLVLDMVRLPESDWKHRIFTTGATASNVIGLACAREWIISEAARRNGSSATVSEDGLMDACKAANIEKIQILTTLPHSSLFKAASIVGLGRASSTVIDLGLYQERHCFDFAALEKHLQAERTASIIVISTGEVNTGFFATAGDELQRIRELADKHGAWIHLDAAFGLQARILPQDRPEYSAIVQGVAHLELADSITADAHKLLNVPYDCGIFFSKHLQTATAVFKNTAAYFSSTAVDLPSPSNIGIENSRRFRALTVYSSCLAMGLSGYQSLLERQIALARGIGQFIQSEPALELLPRFPPSYRRVAEQWRNRIFIIVLFRAADDEVNEQMVARINATRRIYVSGTQWDGRPAARFAISNWQIDVERDLKLIKTVLWDVLG